MTPEEQARVDELAPIVKRHKLGCKCKKCEEWRGLVDPDYRDDAS